MELTNEELLQSLNKKLKKINKKINKVKRVQNNIYDDHSPNIKGLCSEQRKNTLINQKGIDLRIVEYLDMLLENPSVENAINISDENFSDNNVNHRVLYINSVCYYDNNNKVYYTHPNNNSVQILRDESFNIEIREKDNRIDMRASFFDDTYISINFDKCSYYIDKILEHKREKDIKIFNEKFDKIYDVSNFNRLKGLKDIESF